MVDILENQMATELDLINALMTEMQSLEQRLHGTASALTVRQVGLELENRIVMLDNSIAEMQIKVATVESEIERIKELLHIDEV